MNKPLKIYLGCALTYVPIEHKEDFSLLINQIKQELKNQNFEVLDFLSAIKENPKAEEIYDFDIKCLENADGMVALGDYPGTGLGYEICYATEIRKIPTMVGVVNLENLSKFLIGISKKNYKVSILKDPKDFIMSFSKFIETQKN